MSRREAFQVDGSWRVKTLQSPLGKLKPAWSPCDWSEEHIGESWRGLGQSGSTIQISNISSWGRRYAVGGLWTEERHNLIS